MAETETLPLIAALRDRTWRDALLFRALTKSPTVALVLSNPGQRSRVIPPSKRHIGFYRACRVIEVDTRERRIICPISAESQDTGHFFRMHAQIVYRVINPERVALEVADPAGELAQALVFATQRIAAVLHIEQAGTLRESLEELLRPQHGTLAERATLLGLEVIRFDLVVELDQAGRILADLRRERPFHWSAEVVSADQNAYFMVRIGGSYRLHTKQSNNPIQAERFLANILERTSQEFAETIPPTATQYLAEALGEGLRRDLALRAELEKVGIELIRVAANVKALNAKAVSAEQINLDPALFERLFPVQALDREAFTDDGPPLPDWLRVG